MWRRRPFSRRQRRRERRWKPRRVHRGSPPSWPWWAIAAVGVVIGLVLVARLFRGFF